MQYFTMQHLPNSTMLSKMNTDFTKLKKIKTEAETDTLVLCDCKQAKSSVAYDTGGCLRCTVQDCSFFIYNFTESIAAHYTIVRTSS